MSSTFNPSFSKLSNNIFLFIPGSTTVFKSLSWIKVVAEEAKRCGMPYVNHRWLGGMMTNFKTIKKSINRLKELEAMKADGTLYQRFGKKEALGMERELEKLERSLGGIKDMKGVPDVIFVLDVGYEKNAISEAKKLGIPVVGIVDSNNSPEKIDYVIQPTEDWNTVYLKKLSEEVKEHGLAVKV